MNCRNITNSYILRAKPIVGSNDGSDIPFTITLSGVNIDPVDGVSWNQISVAITFPTLVKFIVNINISPTVAIVLSTILVTVRLPVTTFVATLFEKIVFVIKFPSGDYLIAKLSL